MSKSKKKDKGKKPKVRPQSAPFTPEEDARQLQRGNFFKDSMYSAVATMTNGIPDEKIALLLSGGADSTTVLWALLSNGKRPHVYTFKCPGAKPHKDMQKAIALADHYRLQHTVVELSRDADHVAKVIEEIHEIGDGGIKSRPDHEVLYVFHEIVKKASEDGKTHIFNGLGDMNWTLCGRKLEIRGREGMIGPTQADFARSNGAGADGQAFAMTRLCLDKFGTFWCSPNFSGPLNLAYFGLSWRDMNRNAETGDIRLKEVTLRPYQPDIEASNLNVIVKALQAGDTGLREYFDEMIPRSRHVNSLLHRRLQSAQPYYNFLNKRTREQTDSSEIDDTSEVPNFTIAGYVGDGTEMVGLDVEDFADPDTGRAWQWEIDHANSINNDEDDDSEDLFSAALREDAQEEFDSRIDCIGHVFGNNTGRNDCPRAQAGLCGRPATKKNPLRPELCTYVQRWIGGARSSVEELSKIVDGTLREAYEEMVENSRFFEAELVAGHHPYDFTSAPRK